tara:strand:+ start:10197 stop:10643 length:447 start_codon:yes stop_codon:yes gene_type:complete
MDFPKLNLPIADLKIKLVRGNIQVFDVVRKKFFLLTDEEWVRQNFIHYLNSEKKYPFGLMGVEKMIKYNSKKTRADIVLYNTDGSPKVIVECKAPHVGVTQDTFNQIARYNYTLRVDYLILTNGIKYYCCKMDYENNTSSYLKEIPHF